MAFTFFRGGPPVALRPGHVPRLPPRLRRPREQRRGGRGHRRLGRRAPLALAARHAGAPVVMLALVIPTVLAGPSFFAVCRVTRRRTFAPLVRGSVERTCVLAAAGLAAA